MGVLGLIFLVFGCVVTVSASKCLPQTAQCSEYWVKIEPHKNLMETEMDLNLWCNKQMKFYECLEEVLLEGKNGSQSHLPTGVLVSKLFAQDLCSDGSNNRKRLLNNAACINQLNTEYCSLPEYLDIVTPDSDIPPSRCSLSERTFSCIAATMVLHCGFDAARVYRAMLKITRYSDEVCDIEMSEGIPRCEERKQDNPLRDEKLSEIYYGLVNRIGTIPDQEHDESISAEVDDAEIGVEDVVTEAIKSALDSLGEDVESEQYNADDIKDESLETDSEDISEDTESLKKRPIITEIYRGILFFNFSGTEYAVYWRQPGFVAIENFTCEHLQPSYSRGVIFRCKIENRDADPPCVSSDSVQEKITPELIGELDPEISHLRTTEYGPRPAWMEVLDEAYEAKKLRDELKSRITQTETDMPNVSTTGSTLLHVARTLAQPEKADNWWEYDVMHNSIFPQDVHEELMNLFLPEPQEYDPPPMNHFKIGNTRFFLIYDHELTNAIENMTCSRLNECHPKGRGLWRCKMWTRKQSTCDECYEGEGTTINELPVSYIVADGAKIAESWANEPVTTEETIEAEGSGTLDETAEETIALIFSDPESDEDAVESSSGSSVHIASEEEREELTVEDSENESKEQPSETGGNEADGHEGGIGLLILEQKLDSSTENASELIYAVGDGNEESEEIFPVEGEFETLHKNVLVFEGVPGAVNLDDLYTILNVSDDENVVDS